MPSLMSLLRLRTASDSGISAREAQWYEPTFRTILLALVGGIILTFLWYALLVGKAAATTTLRPWQKLTSDIAELTVTSPDPSSREVTYLRNHAQLAHHKASARPIATPLEVATTSIVQGPHSGRLSFALLDPPNHTIWVSSWGVEAPADTEDKINPLLYFTISRVMYKSKRLERASLNVGECEQPANVEEYLKNEEAYASYTLTVVFDIDLGRTPAVVWYQKLLCAGAIPDPKQLLIRSPAAHSVPTGSYEMLRITSLLGVMRPSLIANDEFLAVEDFFGSFKSMASQYCARCDSLLEFLLEDDELRQARDKAFLVNLLESVLGQTLPKEFSQWRASGVEVVPDPAAVLAATMNGAKLENAIGWLRRFNGSDSWGRIQFFTTVAAWTLAVLLVLRIFLLFIERRESSRLSVDPQIDRHQQYWLALRDRLHEELADKQERGQRVPYMMDLMFSGLNVWAKSGSTTEAVSQVKARTESLNDRLQSIYDLFKDLLIVITGIGFFGTVIGIGLSLGKAGGVLTSLEHDKMRVINSLTNALGISFDTTIIALIFFVVLSAWISVSDRLERKAINDAELNVQEALGSLTGKVHGQAAANEFTRATQLGRPSPISLWSDSGMSPGVLFVAFAGAAVLILYGYFAPEVENHELAIQDVSRRLVELLGDVAALVAEHLKSVIGR